MKENQPVLSGNLQTTTKVLLAPWLGTLGVLAFYIGMNWWLYESVMRLIKAAANPFFVFLIIITTVVGQLLTVWQAWRLLGESKYLNHVTQQIGKNINEDKPTQERVLQETLQKSSRFKKLAVWKLFGQLQHKRSRVMGYDQPLLRVNLRAFEDEIQRRAVVPQYIANTLIGLGLFGTFLGLIVTLKEVAMLIGLFSVTGTADSTDMMSQFFQKMSGPLGGMGEAFVASLMGLGGSIVNTVQLLGFKKMQALLAHQAEMAYIGTAESIYGSAHDEEGLPVEPDLRLAELQLKEMTSLRIDMHKQTDAILMAASRMRQASETMGHVLERLEKLHTTDDLRPRLEEAAVVIEQRLDTLVHKFEDSQQAQHGLLSVARDLHHGLTGISEKTISLVASADTTSREMVELRSALLKNETLNRDALNQHIEAIKSSVHADISSVVSAVGENTRQQRETAAVIGHISTHARETVAGLANLTSSTQKVAEQVQPQLVELIARLEISDQAVGSLVRYDWNEINHKLDKLQTALGESRKQ